MSEHETGFDTETHIEIDHRAAHRGVDPVALVFGLAALVASAYVLTDGAIGLPDVDPRWAVAGGALLIGLIMLLVSLRSGRRRRNR